MGLGASASDAAIIVFDDEATSGFSRAWYTPRQDINVHTGTYAASTSNGQVAFEQSTGVTIGENQILEMWINTSNASAASGLMLVLDYDSKTNIQFDERNVPTKFKLDGVEQTWVLGTGITTDADPATWQKLEIDLFQKTYTGFPYVEHQVQSTSLIKKINFRNDGELLVDDVQLTTVPEPAAAGALLGLGALLAIRRRQPQ